MSQHPDPVTAYGLTALSAAASALKPITTSPNTVPADSLAVPETALATRIDAYAKALLPKLTYLHSRRVYSYGVAIASECFPYWKLTPGSTLDETWFLAAMLHDIGTTPEVIKSTRLSYEFWAGLHAMDLLQHPSVSGDKEDAGIAPRDQAESVTEAILRHQDVQDKGQVSLVTQLIQLGTLLDNVGAPDAKRLVSDGTIEVVNKLYDRKGWSGCFRDTVEEEKRLKPWAMVSRIEGFEEMIIANKVTSKE